MDVVAVEYHRRRIYRQSMIDLILVNKRKVTTDVKSSPFVALDQESQKLKMRKPTLTETLVKDRYAGEISKEEGVMEVLENKLRTCKQGDEVNFDQMEGKRKNFKEKNKEL